ncbi:LuxR C-terminal-related transcriptional regulator [Streptomyces sp. NPDC060184]|uniref:helix-turn-helix transcriptional regulator n=1 Tax=Streptomyces sp. NPDC060184 TaxID=3347064 RepID=UPI00364DE651
MAERHGTPHGLRTPHFPADDGFLAVRAAERHLVTELLSGTSGGGRVLRVSGDAGTGKSALLRFASTAAARQGYSVLTASPAPAERELRYAALHRLLHPRLPRLGQVPADARSLLRAAFGGSGEAPAPDRLAGAALTLLATVPGPVLLCVDDLDRLDTASQDTLRLLAGLVGATRTSLAMAERVASAAPLAPDELAVALGPLGTAESRDLVRRSGRAKTYAEEELVLAVAGGNPLAITELAVDGRALGDTAGFGMLPATPRLAEAYARDLEGLSSAARDVLLVAALSCSSGTPDVLRAGARLLGSDTAARAGLAEAAARSLIVESEDHLRFPRPLVRPAVLHLESTARRMSAHAALGRSIASPPHAAWHAAQCAVGGDEELAENLERLADGPQPGTAVLSALAALDRAARVTSEPGRRANRSLRAAELACHHGLPEQALQQARGIAAADLGPLGRSQLLWLHDLLSGNSTGGRERIAELCAAARDAAADHPALAQKLLHAAAGRCWWQRAGSAERERVVRAVRELRPRPWDPRDLAVMALTDPLSTSREPLPDTSALSGEDRMLLGQVAHLTGDLVGAAPLLAEAEVAARADGRHARLPRILVARALGEIWLSTRWQVARGLAVEGKAIAERTGQADWAARAAGVHGVIDALQGRHDTALARAAEVEEASLRLGQSGQLGLASLTRALASSDTGRYAEGYAQLRGLFTEHTTPYAFEQFWGLAFLVEAALPARQSADAAAVVAHVERQTRGGRAPLLRRVLAYSRAALAPDAEAEACWRRALDDEAGQWPLLHAMSLFGYGAWLRRCRRVVDSREPLARAEAVFRELGCTSRTELTAAELAAAGRPETEPAEDGASGVLTPRELTIARLAARGLSNRAIGEQLRLSSRTVAVHLYKIFPKLDVTSRGQLAGRIGKE